MLKAFFRGLLTLFYRVEVTGLEHFQQAGERVLIIANHTSFLDPLLLGVFLPEDVTFAINTYIAERWWVKPFVGLSRVFRMDPTHPISLKELIYHLKQNNKTVIFPEGRITVTGSLMKIYDGPGMVADKSEAMILPIRIYGAEYTYFSRLRNLFRLRLFPKITINIQPPTRIMPPDALRGKSRRKYAGHILADVMTETHFATSHYRQTLFSALLEARAIHGGGKLVAEDISRQPVTYTKLIARILALAPRLIQHGAANANVGVLLPNSVTTLSVVLALQLKGRTPAMLNYTLGARAMVSACQTARIDTVITARRFVEAAHLENDMEALSQQVRLVYLDELGLDAGWMTKLRYLGLALTVPFWYSPNRYSADSPAVVLFTSGSEGAPKGVVLSHANILANHKQVAARINFTPKDVVLNSLPMFHSFGFTVGSLLPVLNGMQVFFYPTPLHYAVIPEVAYEISATVLFGTNTFLAAYAKKAHSYDFYSVRYVVAGAEKLQESTRQLWLDKFGIRILEGYGATETAPVASVNTPMDYRAGSVGRLLPGLVAQLEVVPGISDGGRLHLSGPNIMAGYLLPEQPGVLVPPESQFGPGWYDTGDIVAIDSEGFVHIKGRGKRFAKIGGEMVSLTLVEQLAANAWPDALHAAIAVPDARKGEQIYVLTTQRMATLAEFEAAADGVAKIAIPKKILPIDKMPVLGTGKIDYPAATAWLHQQLRLDV
ncbi:MAG: AMP-binding protein [Methylococcales bacterium]|nr:AMP-binding protein [Methylococcales bacterium]